MPDGQWYLHMFAPEQPDFNWDHPEVREDFLRTLRFWSDRGVDGFRVDVAHSLVKDLSEPLAPTAELPPIPPALGRHPLWDQDGVHEVYAEWRRVLDEYDPPRTAVAEAWVHRSRLAPYAHPTGLGQAFTFDLLDAPWDPAAFREIVSDVLDGHHDSGSSSTWVLSNHDVVRHASRYGLPQGDRAAISEAWLGTDGQDPALDREAGLRRARAATLFMLALPGSAYLYQGEELGLHEVADLPAEALQDPTWERSGHTVKGRDGCRVPIPWTPDGPSYGFGEAAPHLPQPGWFGEVSVAAQEGDPRSTLALYREALRLRHDLQGAEELTWHSEPGAAVLDLERPGGWRCVTNMGAATVDLPDGRGAADQRPARGRAAPRRHLGLAARLTGLRRLTASRQTTGSGSGTSPVAGRSSAARWRPRFHASQSSSAATLPGQGTGPVVLRTRRPAPVRRRRRGPAGRSSRPCRSRRTGRGCARRSTRRG